MAKYSTEIILSTLSLIWMLFAATNINQSLGTIYTGFILGSLSLLIIAQLFFNKKLDITFSNERVSTFSAILGGVTGWIILMVIQSLVFRFESLTHLLGTTALALADSKFANWLTFGVVIAYIETTLWARAYELFADNFKIRINKGALFKIGTWILIGALSLLFMAFHLTSKGIHNTATLVIVFIMMFISLILVTIYEETRSAILLHVIANSLAGWYLFFGGI